jgi:hypothetical protein
MFAKCFAVGLVLTKFEAQSFFKQCISKKHFFHNFQKQCDTMGCTFTMNLSEYAQTAERYKTRGESKGLLLSSLNDQAGRNLVCCETVH